MTQNPGANLKDEQANFTSRWMRTHLCISSTCLHTSAKLSILQDKYQHLLSYALKLSQLPHPLLLKVHSKSWY